MNSWTFIIVAGGSGKRLGGTPKQFRQLSCMPMWMWSLKLAEKLYNSGHIADCVVAFPDEKIEECRNLMKGIDIPTKIVESGFDRSDSVYNALAVSDHEYVLIHDAARPFLSEDIVLRVMNETSPDTGAIPCIPVADALKRTSDDNSLKVVNNSDLFKTQTPQAFPRKRLMEILSNSTEKYKDEAEAWIDAGYNIRQVPGHPQNFKITYTADWELAESIARPFSVTRTGTGYDLHPLIPGRKLVIGGIDIPDFPLGLEGHSDADILVHVICDSLLGAIGKPDIGVLFPASDHCYKNIQSTLLLNNVIEILKEANWVIESIDVVLHAQKPKLQPYSNLIQRNLDRIFLEFGGHSPVLSLKFKSGEKIGSVGSCECMQAWAVACVSRIERLLY